MALNEAKSLGAVEDHMVMNHKNYRKSQKIGYSNFLVKRTNSQTNIIQSLNIVW